MTLPGQPDHDPALTLMRAERDGLLRYLGYSSGNQYDVVVSGLAVTVAAFRVAVLVRVLRQIRRMTELGIPVVVVDVHPDGGQVSVPGGPPVDLGADAALAWMDGYMAGWQGPGPEHDGVDQLAAIRALLTRPADADRARLVLLGLMYGRGEENVSIGRLAQAVGWTKNTVLAMLKFGRPIAGRKLDRLMAGLGQQWADPARRAGVAGLDPAPEHPGIARLRRIVDAADRGWLRYVDVADPNQARRLGRYRLALGGQVHEVPGDQLEDWLAGVAAVHRGDGRGGAGS